MTKKYSHIYLTGKTEISMDGEPDKLFKCGTHEDLELDYARLFFMGQKANAGTTSIFSGITVKSLYFRCQIVLAFRQTLFKRNAFEV